MDWNKEKRDALALKWFGDPDKREYPIQDQEDVNAAAVLIGKAPEDEQIKIKKRIIAICKKLGLEAPKDWTEEGKAMSFAAEDLSYGDLMNAIASALGTDPDDDGEEEWPYVVDVMPSDGRFVYGCDGQLYERGYSVDEQGNVKLIGGPKLVRAETTYVPVQLSFSQSVGDDDWVIYEGEIFRAGNYADKGFSASESYLRELAQNTKFAPIKVQHDGSAFDNPADRNAAGLKGAGLFLVEAFGNVLRGKVRLPKWLKEALGNEIKVSVGLAGDKIAELSIVDNPRVATALIRTFAAARHSKADLNEFQAIHDHAVSLGAKCGAEMAGARHSKKDMDDIQAIHDMAVQQGADCSLVPNANSEGAKDFGGGSAKGSKTKMSWIDKARALFKGDPEAAKQAGIEIDELEDDPVTGTLPTNFSAKHEAELQALKEARLKADRAALRSQAITFANDLQAKGKITKADHAFVVNDFIRRAKEDCGGVVAFSDEGTVNEGDGLKELRAFWANQKPLQIFNQIIGDKSVDPNGEAGSLSEELMDQVMQGTALGREAKARMSVGSGGTK